jgi:hypothetical protein
MFGSRSVGLHLARGLAGLVLGVLAYLAGLRAPWLMIPLGLAAVAMLGGCPTCWVLGWTQTLERQRSRKAAADAAATLAIDAPRPGESALQR